MDCIRVTSYIRPMVIQFLQQATDGKRAETHAEREARIRREAATIEQARAEIAAGYGLDDAALAAWLDELDHNPKAPIPRR
jgi:hypothetical protein